MAEEKINEVIEEEVTEDRVEERYVVARKWKRFVAFLIDFILFIAIVYLGNNYLTKPYIYSKIYDVDELKETLDEKYLQLATREGLVNSDGSFCTYYPVRYVCVESYAGHTAGEVITYNEYNDLNVGNDESKWSSVSFSKYDVSPCYICIEAYGSHKIGDTVTYSEYKELDVSSENASKWFSDTCFVNLQKVYSLDEYIDMAEDYDSKLNRYNNLTWIIDSFVALILVYIIPALIFKSGITIGKKIVGILVVDNFGKPIKPMMYLFRTIIGFWTIEFVTSVYTYYIILVISGLITIINIKGKAIHDYVFGTFVVDKKKEERLVVYYREEEPKIEETKAEKIIDGEEYY